MPTVFNGTGQARRCFEFCDQILCAGKSRYLGDAESEAS